MATCLQIDVTFAQQLSSAADPQAGAGKIPEVQYGVHAALIKQDAPLHAQVILRPCRHGLHERSYEARVPLPGADHHVSVACHADWSARLGPHGMRLPGGVAFDPLMARAYASLYAGEYPPQGAAVGENCFQRAGDAATSGLSLDELVDDESSEEEQSSEDDGE